MQYTLVYTANRVGLYFMLLFGSGENVGAKSFGKNNICPCVKVVGVLQVCQGLPLLGIL